VFCTTRNLTLSIAAMAAFKICLSAAAPPSLAGIQMITPERLRGIMSACFLGVVTLVAVGMGPTLIGLITDYVFGDENALSSSLLVMTLIMTMVGAATAWISRPPVKAAMAK